MSPERKLRAAAEVKRRGLQGMFRAGLGRKRTRQPQGSGVLTFERSVEPNCQGGPFASGLAA
jgi:hypothetical protein